MSNDQLYGFYNLPRRLRFAREYAGLSVAQIAKLCNVSKNTIRNAERPLPEDALPTTKIDLIIQIAEITGVPFEFIAAGSEPVDIAAELLETLADEHYASLLQLREIYVNKWGKPSKKPAKPS